MNRFMKVCIGFVVLMFCFGCAAFSKQCTKNQEQPCSPIVKKTRCIQKADNFLVILDTSETMKGKYQDRCKLGLAKSTIARMNQSIPDIKLNGGLRTFGHGYGLFSIKQTDLIYGMMSYEKEGLSEALGKAANAGGDSPMAKALCKAKEDLQGVSGNTAVILVSDGKPTDQGVLQAAEGLKKAYGNKVCIYTIQVGSDYYGEKLLRQIAGIGGCGVSINADSIASCAEMAAFVKQVFFRELPKPKPRPSKVIINSVLFNFDSNIVKPEAAIVLEEVAGMLKKNSRDVVIEGHTCSIGTEDYNMGLSERRASAVRDFLIDQDIEASRLNAKGVGEVEPVADNTSKDGRERNRRVEFEVMK